MEEDRALTAPPLIAFPPPEVVIPTRATPVFESVVAHAQNELRTEETPDGHVWSAGIDYDSITVPDAAPRGTFADPLDGPEPFDD